METCKTCRFWEHPHEDFVYREMPQGVCTLHTSVVTREPAPAFDQPVFVRLDDWDATRPIASDAAGPTDDTGHVNFVTGPDFGCVKHEPREDGAP